MPSGSQNGKSNNPKGKPKGAKSVRIKAWESMGKHMIGTWTEYMVKHGQELIEQNKFDEFYPIYKDMVQYFKPKLAATQIDANIDTEININIKEPEWGDESK